MSYIELSPSTSTVYASDTPPAGAPDNSIWMETDTGITYFRWNDGTSTQWVSMLAGTAPLDSPVFTGDPRAPTPTAGDNDTSIATTAFVQTAAVAAAADALAAVPITSGAWTDYTVTTTWSSGGAGNGTGRYMRIGRTIFVTYLVTCTTTGVFGSLSLPTAAAAIPNKNMGFASAREIAANGRGWHGQISTSATAVAMTEIATNTNGMTAGWTFTGFAMYEM